MRKLHNLSKAELVGRIEELEARLAGESTDGGGHTERLRSILETAVEGIVTIDQTGTIESVNPAAERLFGYTARELIGRNVNILMPSPYREEHDSYLGNYHRTGQAKIIGIGRVVEGQRRDGTIFPMELSVSEVLLDCGRRVYTGFVRDISERRRLEREILEISDREQRRIGQDLHDGICQQLAGIELMSQVLEQNLVPIQSALAGQAAMICSHVRGTIEQTRGLAHGLSPVELHAEGLMSALRALAEHTRQVFNSNCRYRCDRRVLVHDSSVATHLYRIAQEAVGNSVKHGRAKEITISLTTTPERIVLAVRDNGVGIPPDAPDSRGMGLRTMNYRAGMIGGTLVVQREAGGGTSVVCTVKTSPIKRTRRKEPRRSK